MFFIYELPIPRATKKQKEFIIQAAATLLIRNSDAELYGSLLNNLGITIDERIDLVELRAKLEVFIAKHLYHLSLEDWQYLTSTFTYGEQSATKIELDNIISESKKEF
jgi:hypothetical protein